MKLRFPILLTWVALLAPWAPPLHAETSAPLTPEFREREITRLVGQFGPRLLKSRYLERGECRDTTYPGWEGFPLKKWRYTVFDWKTSQTKHAEVILLNPDPRQVSRWVVSACAAARGGWLDPRDTDRLFHHILGQSGGQFPVAGIVYEDMEGDGLNKVYCFRHGVTVQVPGIPNGQTTQPTETQIDLSLYGPVSRVRRYARIQSTSPGDYVAAGGRLPVGPDSNPGPGWMDVIRTTYQAAWGHDEYELMTALARRRLDGLKDPPPPPAVKP